MATMYQLLKNAGFKAKEAKQISTYLESVGITDINGLENAPTKIGARLFGHDIYSLIGSVVNAEKTTPDVPVPVKEEPVVKENDNGRDNQTEPEGDSVSA